MYKVNEVLDEFFSSHMPSLSDGLRENRLGRMERLLRHIGNPEKDFRSIHCAGSKGKGTTCSALSWIMKENGIRCGLYLSPHVYDIRERFTLSTCFFSDEEYLTALEELRKRLKGFSIPHFLGPAEPTTFELYTAYAYLLFSLTGCSWAVIETGLGGRLDATNTISSASSVITRIELEHTAILGNTLSLIAAEKAGIIRENTPTFILEQEEEAVTVFKEKAKSLSSALFIFSPSPDDIKTEGTYTFNCHGALLRMKTFPGDIRRLDIFYALFVLSKMSLIRKNSVIDFTSSSFSLPGRFEERILDGRRLILDGAHTVSSLSVLSSALPFPDGKPRILIFSSAHDKDHISLLNTIAPGFDVIIISSTGKWKKSAPEKIYDDALSLFPEKKILLRKDGRKAIEEALAFSGPGSLITVTGSFYLLSEIDRSIRKA